MRLICYCLGLLFGVTGQAVAQRSPPSIVLRPLPSFRVPQDRAAPLPDGEAVYFGACATCHSKGRDGAPRLSDRAAWSERLPQGIETLVKHTLEGYGSAPPRGACDSCSYLEIRAAIDFMLKKSR